MINQPKNIRSPLTLPADYDSQKDAYLHTTFESILLTKYIYTNYRLWIIVSSQ